MPTYNALTRDMKFLIHDVLDSSSLQSHEKFGDVDVDLMDAILEEGAKFSSEVLIPLNVVGDKVGCKRNADGSVDAPPQNPS